MKRLLSDYLRRKIWIIAPCSVVVLAFSLAQALWPRQAAHAGLTGLLYQFSFLMAALPLSFDLQQGVMRATSVLPFNARQFGRVWWWAGVGVPASAVSLILLLCAVVQLLVHPDVPVKWDALALTVVSLWLWLGTAFTVLFNLGASPARDWRQRTKNIGVGVAWGLMAGCGFVFMRWIESYVGAQIVFLTIGVALTVIGWLRAENMVLARASLRVAAPSGEGRPTAPAFQVEKQFGGLAYLITRNCLRTTALGSALLLISPFMSVISNPKPWRVVLKSADAGPLPFWLIFIFALLPVLGQLRFLRTLPLSASRLALVLLTLFLAPGILIGAASALLADIISGPGAALLVGQRSFFAVTTLSLTIPFALWRGLSRGSYMLLVFLIVVLQTGPIIFGSALGRSIAFAAPVALLLPMLAFLLSRLILERGAKAYRASPMLFAPAWGGAR